MGTRERYEKKLKELELKLVNMCKVVEKSIELSIIALKNKDRTLARQVYENDRAVDDLEHDLEQSCLNILLMESPVAGDFKEVSAILKMITDLERIGDQSADICHLVLSFEDEDYIKELKHIPLMAEVAESMVKDSIHAYVTKDATLLAEIIKRDDEVDALFEEIKAELIDYIKRDANNANQSILFMMIAKYLERIGDHATNICEWTEYCISGNRRNTN
ncbi:MAG: phosphate signaling complex protein PhoU [Clostridia bacterium]